MEHIVTEVLCDLCFKINKKRSTDIEVNEPMKIGDVEARLDLCRKCASQQHTIGELKLILAEYGNPVIKKKRATARKWADKEAAPPVDGGFIDCPVIECDAQVSTRKILRGHARRKHDMTLKELDQYARDHGLMRDVDGYKIRTAVREQTPANCDICGHPCGSGSGVTLHKRSKHPEVTQQMLINGKVPVAG